MITWRPALKDRKTPKYHAIAAAIDDDVNCGRLLPGVQLPTQRELARYLGVTVGTVSRAYAEAERRGLVVGEVGRGTFVRESGMEESEFGAAMPWQERTLDLSLNIPPSVGEGTALAEVLKTLSTRSDLSGLLQYQQESGAPRHRAAGAAWLRRVGLDAKPEQTLVCAGAQHAMTVVFSTLLRPGDLVLTEELTYPGMKALGQMLGLHLEGLPMDEGGLRPDAFKQACNGKEAKALYCVPTIQNPTGSTLSLERRRQIASIARENGVLLVEDDVHAMLADDAPPPISTLYPEGGIYIASTAKNLTPGLRVGYLHAPEQLTDRLSAGIRATLWMAAPLMAEIATRWIEDGTAHRIVESIRKEAAARRELAGEILIKYRQQAVSRGFQLWLSLPEPWTASDFVAHALQRGVAVAGSEAFAVGRLNKTHAIRISLGAAPDRTVLVKALETLREVLEGCCEPYLSVV